MAEIEIRALIQEPVLERNRYISIKAEEKEENKWR